jgi:hypothetical protein
LYANDDDDNNNMMMMLFFTAVGFPPGGSGRQTRTKLEKRQLCTKGEIIYRTVKKTNINKIENKHTKRENKHKIIIKNKR